MRTEEDAFDVYLEDAIEVLLGGGFRGANVGDAGVVYQDVQPPEFGVDRLESRADVRGVRYVTLEFRVRADIEHRDARAGSVEQSGNRLPDPRAGPGDRRYLAGELEHDVPRYHRRRDRQGCLL